MDDVRTLEPTGTAASPLLRMATMVPDASLGVARDLSARRAACSASERGMTTSVVNVATRPAFVRGPLERVEARVDVLAAQGSAARQAEVVRVGVIARRAEPMITEFMETVVAVVADRRAARRIDVNGLLERVDVNVLIDRIDLATVVNEVLAGIEIGDLIHDSTTGIASDVRDSARSGAVRPTSASPALSTASCPRPGARSRAPRIRDARRAVERRRTAARAIAVRGERAGFLSRRCLRVRSRGHCRDPLRNLSGSRSGVTSSVPRR